MPANITDVPNFTGSDTHNLVLEPELNAYFSDVRSELPVLAQAFPDQTFDYGQPNVYWPFNPEDPGNTGTPLTKGEYVRMVGTLYQDGHGLEEFDGGVVVLGVFVPNSASNLHGHGVSHIEIHPPDVIERNRSRKLTEDQVMALVKGQMLTTDANPTNAIPRTRFMGLRVAVPVDLLSDLFASDSVKIIPTIPRPSPECKLKFKEWVDGRFTDLKTVSSVKGPDSVAAVSVVDNDVDPHVDVTVQVKSLSRASLPLLGRPGLFKAIYQVWWDCPPTISCPSNQTINTAPGQCSATTTYTVTATDEEPGVTTSCSPTSGATFQKCTTTVLCSATDASGNTAGCSFTVTVNDNQNPTITCPPNGVVSATSSAGAVVNYAAPTVTDNCPSASAVCLPPSGSTFPIATNTVTCTATDATANKSQCTFTVRVKGAAEQTGDLMGLVRSFRLKSAIENSLLVKLQAALTAINTGDKATACASLTDFINEVKAQMGKKTITVGHANQMIAAAVQIKTVLGCP